MPIIVDMNIVEHLAKSLVNNLSELFIKKYKNLREKLAIMIATLPNTKTHSDHTMELAT